MKKIFERKRRAGFTLVEVLVTTVVIGVLAAVVLPALARQAGAADPARVSSDLNNIKMGIELFAQNLRPEYPGDLEDLVNNPDAAGSTTSSTMGDLALDGNPYDATVIARWKGPYVAQTLPAAPVGSGATPWKAGAAGFFENAVAICDLAASAECASTDGSKFVAVVINGLGEAEANDIDQMLDGAVSGTAGMFRFTTGGSPAYYYTIPFVQ